MECVVISITNLDAYVVTMVHVLVKKEACAGQILEGCAGYIFKKYADKFESMVDTATMYLLAKATEF